MRLRLALAAVGLAAALPASGHPLAPALLELREGPDEIVSVRIKTSRYPRSRAAAALLVPRLPEHCRRVGSGSTSIDGGGVVERFEVRCPGGLVSREIGFDGLRENAIDALLRVELRDGRVFQHVLRAGDDAHTVPERPGAGRVVVAYLEMGARHIASGLDHLLFVFGLVLLVASGPGYASRLLVTLSAFTLGHCVTLGAAALGWVRLPGPPIELLIAASVLALAVELTRSGAGARRPRVPWLLAAGFGLLHGLGFAGALLEAGLPQGDVPLALLSFNLGIEVGQVTFVLVILAVGALLSGAGLDTRLPGWTRRVPVYAMGSLAAMWCIERMVAMLP